MFLNLSCHREDHLFPPEKNPENVLLFSVVTTVQHSDNLCLCLQFHWCSQEVPSIFWPPFAVRCAIFWFSGHGPSATFRWGFILRKAKDIGKRRHDTMGRSRGSHGSFFSPKEVQSTERERGSRPIHPMLAHIRRGGKKEKKKLKIWLDLRQLPALWIRCEPPREFMQLRTAGWYKIHELGGSIQFHFKWECWEAGLNHSPGSHLSFKQASSKYFLQHQRTTGPRREGCRRSPSSCQKCQSYVRAWLFRGQMSQTAFRAIIIFSEFWTTKPKNTCWVCLRIF